MKKTKKEHPIIKNFLILVGVLVGCGGFIFGLYELGKVFTFLEKSYKIPFLVSLSIFMVILCEIGSLIMFFVNKSRTKGNKKK